MEKERILFEFYKDKSFVLYFLCFFIGLFIAFICTTLPEDALLFSSLALLLSIAWGANAIKQSSVVKILEKYIKIENMITHKSEIINFKDIQKVIFYGYYHHSKSGIKYNKLNIISNNKKYSILESGFFPHSSKTMISIFKILKDSMGDKWDQVYIEQ